MSKKNLEVQLTTLEKLFVIGIIACLFFGTWRLCDLISEGGDGSNWFDDEEFIWCGIALFISISTIYCSIITRKFKGRFSQTVNKAFLWYGSLLLLITVLRIAFELFPIEVGGFVGAIMLIFAIYILQKKYFTKERITRKRLEEGKCFSCGNTLPLNVFHCPVCGIQVGRKCPKCNSFTKLMDNFCLNCGEKFK